MIVFYVTFPDMETAQEIGEKLIMNKVIACANYTSTHSVYMWEKNLVKEPEIVAHFKTSNKNRNITHEKILEMHPYEVPCILSWEVIANKDYEKWIENETSP